MDFKIDGSQGAPRTKRLRAHVETIEARRAVADVKTAARELSPEAMDTLKQAMADQKAPWSARIAAAIAVLDRGWGKPTQALDANLSFFEGLTDHERQKGCFEAVVNVSSAVMSTAC
jgi:hypothetical protein